MTEIKRSTPRSSAPGRFVLWLIVAFVLLVLDRITKAAVINTLAYGSFVHVTPFFNLCHVRNTGAAFSFLGDAGGWQIFAFAGIALLVTAACLFFLWHHAKRNLFACSMALVISGALGNLWDRLVYGFVTDFLDFHAFGYHWPAFNVADICICIGAALLVFDEFRCEK